METFDFCPNTRVAEEVPPEEPTATSMNGWEFTAKPSVPYRATFKVTLSGLYWRLNAAGTALDETTNATTNAGALRAFFLRHRTWKTFTFQHEYLGPLTVRFKTPVQLPKALPSAGGLLPDVEVILIHHNPGY